MTTRAIIYSPGGTPVDSPDIGADSSPIPSTRMVAPIVGGAVVDLDESDVEELSQSGFIVKVFDDVEQLRVGTLTIDIEKPPDLPRAQQVPRNQRATWPQHLVQFVAPPLPEFLAQLDELGVDVIDRVDRYAVSVLGNPEMMKAAQDLACVAWTGPFHPGYKLRRGVLDSGGTVDVSIGVLPTGLSALLELVEKLGGTIREVEKGSPGVPQTQRADRVHVVHASLAASAVRNEIIQIPEVTFVELDVEMQPDDERAAQIVAEDLDGAAAPATAPNTGYAANLASYGIDGTGVTIGVIDTGIDNHDSATLHQDLRGRLAFFADQTAGTRTVDGWVIGAGNAGGGHGTHVAGIAAGDGSTGDTDPQGFVLGLGIAPGAEIGSVNYLAANPQPTVAAVIQAAAANGADVNNNSWGTPTPSGYDSRCTAIDQLVRDPNPTQPGFEEMCVVFSVGNSGGMPGSMTGPHEAKNAIVVGNGLTSRPGEGFFDDINGISFSSSRGPTADGRLCPTVVAPGTNVVSALTTIDANAAVPGIQRRYTTYTDTGGTTHNQHTSLSGSSMAAPQVSGLCALLIEWWRDRTGATPSAAMLRALVVNGAEDMAGGANWKTVMNPGTPTWTASGSNQRFVGLGFTPGQIWGFGSGGTGFVQFTQRTTAAQINATGQWSYAAGSDTLTVRALNGNLPDQIPSPAPVSWDQIVALDNAPIANVPNNDQGWGRVSLANIVTTAPDSDRGPKIFSDQRIAFTANGQSHRIRVSPVDPTRPMRVTMCWTDPPGTSLVNDLDLRVAPTGGGAAFVGNNFVNGFSAAGGLADSTNNIECVYIQNPAGTYDVDVLAASVTTDARTFALGSPWQDYAIVIDNAQVPAAAPVNVATVVDRSSSMVTFGYDARTAQGASQFVSMLNIDDAVGVVSFGTDSRIEFPTDGSGSVVTLASTADRDLASGAAAGIGFGGMTAMGEGISDAGTLLSSASSNRAIVLLTDGYDNGSPDAATAAAALDPDIAMYACAMGPASDQVLLEALATATGGRYYFMPTIDDLFEIYNWIRGQVTGTGVIANESSAASKSSVSAFVDGCARRATFGVAWTDQNVAYTPRGIGRANQVSVRLRAPNGKLLSPLSSLVRVVPGKGYVVFDVDQPASGMWTVEVETKRAGHLPYTVGGFVESDIVVDLEVRGRAVTLPGRPFEIGISASGGGVTNDDLRARVCVSPPRIGRNDAIGEFGSKIRRRTRTLRGDQIPTGLVDAYNIVKLLDDKDGGLDQGDDVCFDLAPKRPDPTGGPFIPFDRFDRLDRLPGLRGGRFDEILDRLQPSFPEVGPRAAPLQMSYGKTEVEGNYNVRATVSGVSRECGRFVRHEFATVLVGKPRR